MKEGHWSVLISAEIGWPSPSNSMVVFRYKSFSPLRLRGDLVLKPKTARANWHLHFRKMVFKTGARLVISPSLRFVGRREGNHYDIVYPWLRRDGGRERWIVFRFAICFSEERTVRPSVMTRESVIGLVFFSPPPPPPRPRSLSAHNFSSSSSLFQQSIHYSATKANH